MNPPESSPREVVDPEVLPPGGPVPRQRARESGSPASPVGPRPDWIAVLSTAAALDLLGLAARGPMRWMCALAGAGCAFYLALKLRALPRQWGWITLAGAVYGSFHHAYFLPIALGVAAWRLWLGNVWSGSGR